MRYAILGAMTCVCLSGLVQAQAPDPQIVAPITRFMDAFNKGDAAGASATHAAAADLVIVDEVTPFTWHGEQAFKMWAADLESSDKKLSITDQHVAVGAPTRVESDGASAYVIVPTVYTFKQSGEAMRANAQMTLVLKKGPGGWLIHGWTWTGPRAQKVAGAARK
ncbi:MAG: nuclear transport factor 2 family protein [Acidobacteriota bacterium]